MEVKARYDEVFEVEIDGWCYGITNFSGEVFPALIHHVIQEMSPVFHSAIQNNFVFNIFDVSEKVSKAAKYLIHEDEVAFSILAQLPNPVALNEDEQFILAQIIDPAEQKYGSVIEKLQNKWDWELENKTGPKSKAA